VLQFNTVSALTCGNEHETRTSQKREVIVWLFNNRYNFDGKEICFSKYSQFFFFLNIRPLTIVINWGIFLRRFHLMEMRRKNKRSKTSYSLL